MYLALFLTPWVLVFALSSVIFNHLKFFSGGKPLAQFEQVEELPYEAAFSDGIESREAGLQILRDLGREGAFFVRQNQKITDRKFTVNRNRAVGPERIHYYPQENKVVIERQKVTPSVFLVGLHLKHGTGHPGISANLWGVILDLVIVGMFFWVLSGIWMWLEIKPARFWGAVSGLAGVGLFLLFLFTI
ncbi:MAG: hypothetical protein GY892_20290 [Shimia sp.]|jgi:hypothetical protein|nr:hypothetical protein [Shimia sp.]